MRNNCQNSYPFTFSKRPIVLALVKNEKTHSQHLPNIYCVEKCMQFTNTFFLRSTSPSKCNHMPLTAMCEPVQGFIAAQHHTMKNYNQSLGLLWHMPAQHRFGFM